MTDSSQDQHIVHRLASTASDVLLLSSAYGLPVPSWATTAIAMSNGNSNILHRSSSVHNATDGGGNHGANNNGNDHDSRTSADEFMGFIPLLQKLVIYWSIAMVILSTSVLSYGLFYIIVMPSHDITMPLYFDYTGMSTHPTEHHLVQQRWLELQQKQMQMQIQEDGKHQLENELVQECKQNETDIAINHDGNSSKSNHEACVKSQQETVSHSSPSHEQAQAQTQAQAQPQMPPQNQIPNLSVDQRRTLQQSPWAAADLFTKHTQWEPYLDGHHPKPQSRSVLKANQPYTIEIALELPESLTNQELGIFGVHVTLQSANGTTLATSVRSTQHPHESDWISLIRKWTLLVPHLVGAIPETRTIVIPSYHYVMERKQHPLRYITVRLVSRTNRRRRTQRASSPTASIEWTTSHDDDLYNDDVQVSAAHVRIGRELKPYQYVLKHWFFTCAMIGISAIFVFQSTSVTLLMYLWERRRQGLEERASDASLQLELDGSLDFNGDNNGGVEEHDDTDDGPWLSTLVDGAQASPEPQSQSQVDAVVGEDANSTNGQNTDGDTTSPDVDPDVHPNADAETSPRSESPAIIVDE